MHLKNCAEDRAHVKCFYNKRQIQKTKPKTPGGTRKLLEVMDMFIILIIEMVLCIHSYVQTHQIVPIKYL